METINDADIIRKHQNDKSFMHLTRSPMLSKEKLMDGIYKQLYILGFNVGGRPEGIWISRGSEWLNTIQQLKNPKYPMCCMLYRIYLKPRANVLRIKTLRDLNNFDRRFPSYWLNMDYFEFSFYDYLTGKMIKISKQYDLILSKLNKQPNESHKDVLIRNKIIFTNTTDAKKHCKFYRQSKIPIERFKYKDWDVVAQHYRGVIFEKWNINDKKLMYYIWYQTLDVTSGCIWDPYAIKNIRLLYSKKGRTTWEIIK